MQIIINWLKGQQNFTIGATLYKKFGSNEAFKQQLDKGETTARKQQLANELQDLIKPLAPATVPSTLTKLPETRNPKPETGNSQPETSEIPVSNDAVLKAIRNEWLPLYQRMNLLRHSLDKYGSDNSIDAIAYRKPIAAEIKQLEKQINAIWAKHDYYAKEGKLPFAPAAKWEIPTDPLALARLINNIKKSIRTNRKLMKEHADNPKYAELYQQYKHKHKLVTGNDYDEKD